MKSSKLNKTSADIIFPTTHFTPESTTKSFSQTRKTLKPIDSTNDIAKDLSLINKKFNRIMKCVEQQNDVLQERIGGLESEIAECRDTIMLLSTRMDAIHSIYSRLEIEENSKDLLNTESTAVLTVDTTIEYLKSQPIFLDAFSKNNFDDHLLNMILNLDNDVRSVFIEYSLHQLERMIKCFEAYFELKNKTETDDFVELLSGYLSQIFISNIIYIFQFDSKNGNYFCNFKSKNLTIQLKESNSLIASAIKSNSISFFTNPSTEANFSPSLDPLFNSENKPILFIPIESVATFLIVHTDNSCITFSNEDIEIAKLFESLIKPLFEYHNRYASLKKEKDFCEFLNQFQNDIYSKIRFDSLLPFLSQSLSEIMNADEIRIFVVDQQTNKFFMNYRMSEERIIETKYDFTGIPYYVMQNKYHFFTDFLCIENVPSFVKLIDGWGVNKPFGAFPIFQSKEKVMAVLCLTGKNKFNESDFEFLLSITPLLALNIPRCIEMSKLLSAEECKKTMNQYPSTISKFTFESLQQEKAILNILTEMQKGTKAEIISAYISGKDLVFKRLMSVKDGRLLDHDCDDLKSITLVYNSESPINDPRMLSFKFECNSILAVSNKENENIKIVIVCINSMSSTGRFDEGYHLYLNSFSTLIIYAIEIQKRDKEIQNITKNTKALEAAFLDCEEALKYPNSLLAIIQSILKRIQMENFILIRYKPLSKGYECILGSENCKKMTISEENRLICAIKNLAKPSEIKKWLIDSNNSFLQVFPSFSHIVVDPLDSDLFLICTGDSLNSDFELIFNSYSPLVKSLYHNYLLSIQKNISSSTEVNKIDFNSSNFLDSDLSSRLFSVTNLTEAQKIEVVLKFFTSFDLLTIMETNAEEMTRFLLIVRDKYRQIPFHNWDHAVDTIQFAYSCIQRGRLRKFLRPHHTIALLLACLLHDVDHDGYNTTFQVKTKSPLYYVYGEESTVEKHHLAVATKMLNEFLITKKKMLYKDSIFWTTFSKAILATDMIKHFEYIEKFQTLTKNFNSNSEDHLLLLAQLIIKCANVGNCTRPFDVALLMAKKWNEEEKKLNENTNDSSNDLAELEINFDNAIVLPLLKILGSTVNELSDFAIQMEDNKKQWNEILKENSKK